METEFLKHAKVALDIEDREIAISENFRDLPEWDSLAFLSLISVIDDEYDVVIDGETFKRLNTLEDVLKEIQARKA